MKELKKVTGSEEGKREDGGEFFSSKVRAEALSDSMMAKSAAVKRDDKILSGGETKEKVHRVARMLVSRGAESGEHRGMPLDCRWSSRTHHDGSLQVKSLHRST